jgi:hypothetical protein
VLRHGAEIQQQLLRGAIAEVDEDTLTELVDPAAAVGKVLGVQPVEPDAGAGNRTQLAGLWRGVLKFQVIALAFIVIQAEVDKLIGVATDQGGDDCRRDVKCM